MNPWLILQIVTGAAGVLLMFVGQRHEMSLLTYGGAALLGLVGILIGLEAIVRRRIVLGRSRYDEDTYVGPAAVAQGLIFIVGGLAFIGIAALAYANGGRQFFLHLVERPGLALVAFGGFCFLGAVVAISGSVESRQGPRWLVGLNLIASRLLPGLILIVLALGAIALGLFETASPEAFDQMGGGFLEVLFLGR